MAEKSATSTALRQRPHGQQIDVPQNFPKPFHEYATIKVSVLRNLFVRNSWYKPI